MNETFEARIERPCVTDTGQIRFTADHYTFPIHADINGDHDYDAALANAIQRCNELRYSGGCWWTIHLGPQLVATPNMRVTLGAERTYVPRPTITHHR